MDKIINLEKLNLSMGVTVFVALIVAVSSFWGDYVKMTSKVEEVSSDVSSLKSDVKQIQSDVQTIKIDIAKIAESLKKKNE